MKKQAAILIHVQNSSENICTRSIDEHRYNKCVHKIALQNISTRRTCDVSVYYINACMSKYIYMYLYMYMCSYMYIHCPWNV